MAVTPLAINVKANLASKVYGDVYNIPTNGSNVATNGTALLSGQTIVASTVNVAHGGNLASAPVVSSSGSYTLTPTAVTIMDGATNVTANYTITYQTNILTVTKRQIILTANNVSKTYSTLHTFTNTVDEVTVSGASSPALAANQAISTLTLSSTGTPVSAVASAMAYPIVIAKGSVVVKDGNGSGADVTVNYDITLINGGLSINKATQTISFDPLDPKTTTSADFVLTANTTSGLPLSYTSSNTAVAEVYEDNDVWKVRIKGEGTADITASQGGNSNYLAADNVIQSLQIIGTPLPVTLINYTAKADGNFTQLQWQTSNESNNKKFEIYRKADGEKLNSGTALAGFEKIGEVKATVNSPLSIANFYVFTDKSPLNGNNYYKLVQIDKDGKATDLGIRQVAFSLKLTAFSLYPNPTADQVTASFTAGRFSQLQVVDLTGKVLQHVVIRAGESSNVVTLRQYPAGNYIIRLSGKGISEARKVIRE